MRALVLDNEAVQALADVEHPKHRTALAHLEAIKSRRRRGAHMEAFVPTAVRVEARWDRGEAAAALINRLHVQDRPLDARSANVAASIASRVHASVADAHIGAVVRSLVADEVVVLGSDPGDMETVCAPVSIRAIRL